MKMPLLLRCMSPTLADCVAKFGDKPLAGNNRIMMHKSFFELNIARGCLILN